MSKTGVGLLSHKSIRALRFLDDDDLFRAGNYEGACGFEWSETFPQNVSFVETHLVPQLKIRFKI